MYFDRVNLIYLTSLLLIQREQKIKVEPNPDNLYTPVERQPKVFNDLKVPKSLQKDLPYHLKPKTLAEKERKIENERVAVVLEPQERKMLNQMKMMRTIFQVNKCQELFLL